MLSGGTGNQTTHWRTGAAACDVDTSTTAGEYFISEELRMRDEETYKLAFVFGLEILIGPFARNARRATR